MNRTLLAVALAAMVALAGCSALTGSQDGTDGGTETPVPGEQVAVADDSTNATNVNQTVRMVVDEATNGSEWEAIGVTYPRENFTVDSAQHEVIELGVDTNNDGEIDREFDESHISGVNNNAYSFDITLDTDYLLQSGDVVVVGYPAVDNPARPGDYEVEVRLNGAQNATVSITIE